MAKIPRNAPCPCASGKKYKKCCLSQDQAKFLSQKQIKQVKNSLSFQQKDKIASDINKFVIEQDGDKNKIIASPDFMNYMEEFKKLIDNSSTEDMARLSASYDGFHKLGEFLGEFANAIKDGSFDDIIANNRNFLNE